MTHYDTLGVKPDASPEAIKKAWRRLSSSAHPDKGGSTERQQAVNQAYETLSDPERRARYDATGSDAGPPTITDQAKQELLNLFCAILEEGPDDLMGACHKRMLAEVARLHGEAETSQRRLGKLARLKGKMRRKDGGHSLMDGLIDSQSEALRSRIETIERGLAVGKEVERLLAEYEADEVMPPMFHNVQFRPMFLGTGSAL